MTQRAASFAVEDDRPLIGVIGEEDGRTVTRYFADEDDADAATSPANIHRALGLLGV